jgi:hypothetical protein
VIALRPQDPLPEWITHVLALRSTDQFNLGTLEEMRPILGGLAKPDSKDISPLRDNPTSSTGEEYIVMRDVTVAYQDRTVSLMTYDTPPISE